MNSTETLIVTIMTIYTSIIIIGLNKYEARIKDYKKAISDYKRALDLSRDNKYSQQHYTQLQLEAKQLRMSLYELDKDNHLLKQQLAQSKQQVLESRPLQYESNVYHPSLFESQVDFE